MAAPRSRSASPPRGADYPRSISPYDDRSPRSASPRRSRSFSDRGSRDRLNGARGRSYSRDYSEDRGRPRSRSLSRGRRHSDDYSPAPRSSKVPSETSPSSASGEQQQADDDDEEEAELSDDEYMSDAPESYANTRQIVVEKLTKNITEAHVRSLFERYGTIVDIDMPMNRAFGTNRGTAYIVYEEESAAERAFARMHEGWLDGAQLSVSLVVARARMSSRSPPPGASDEAAGSGAGRRSRSASYGRRSPSPPPYRRSSRDRPRYRSRSPLRGPPLPPPSSRRPADTYYGAGVRSGRSFSPSRSRSPPPMQRRPSRSRSRSRSPYGSRSPEYGRYSRRYSRRSVSVESYERERRR